jgi:outer membrane biosynthesis protein TonB
VTPTEPLQSYQPRGIFSTWLGVVLLFALFGLIALVVVRAAPRGNDFEKKRAEARMKKLEDAQKENLTALTSYAWADKAKGVARIPINDAMKLTLAQLAEKKPAPAGPIAAESPAPAANAPAAATTSPTPGTAPSAPPRPDGAKPTPGAGGNEPEHQPAAAANPPPAPPNTQPGANASPAASAPSQPAKAPASPAPSASPSAPGTPLPVRGKTP